MSFVSPDITLSEGVNFFGLLFHKIHNTAALGKPQATISEETDKHEDDEQSESKDKSRIRKLSSIMRDSFSGPLSTMDGNNASK